MLIRKVERTELNVFDVIGVRELARRTGLDIAYLSRVKNDKIAVSQKRLLQLWDAADEYGKTRDEQRREKHQNDN